MLAERYPGESVVVHAFRRDELMSFKVRLGRAAADTCVLSESAGGARGRLLDWLLGKRR
jgi:hypothetical protein